jgi:hypothetical protein
LLIIVALILTAIVAIGVIVRSTKHETKAFKRYPWARAGCYARSAVSAAMCSGPMPQHPPMMSAPCPRHS